MRRRHQWPESRLLTSQSRDRPGHVRADTDIHKQFHKHNFQYDLSLQNMTGSGEDLRVSSDSLESDLGDRDSLESGPCSEDSLQIISDSLGSKV